MNAHSRNALFFSGLCLSIAFVLLNSLAVKLGFFACFALANILMKRRIAILPMILTSCAIVAFNLLAPEGKAFAMILRFPLTEGALLSGIDRAVTFEGLLLASRATVSRDLALPGRFGRLISESFRYFGLISGRKTKITFRNFIESIDALMEELEREAVALK